MTGTDDLCKALLQFRKDWAPKVLTKPCMHYNYSSLQHAFELLDREWEKLCTASNNNFDKISLVWRQLIGFEMRRLPGIDRCVVAQSLYDLIEDKVAVERTYKLAYGGAAATFPVTVADDSIDGLGWDFALGIFGCGAAGGAALDEWDGPSAGQIWETYVKQKLQTCRTYAARPNSAGEPMCNNLSC